MKIELENVAKRYRREWILRKVNLTIDDGKRYAIEGPNGSGKSTLLRMLSGHLTPSKGNITFSKLGTRIDSDQIYQHLSYAAPYIDLIEELSLAEALRFHRRFQPYLSELNEQAIIELLALPGSASKPIRDFFFWHETTPQAQPGDLLRYLSPTAGRTHYEPGSTRYRMVFIHDGALYASTYRDHRF